MHSLKLKASAVFCQAALIAVALGCFGLSTASAQDPAPSQRYTIDLPEIIIEGTPQRPRAFYILNRSSLNHELLDLRTSFVREVVRSAPR